jgi:6-phosphogluconolactonase
MARLTVAENGPDATELAAERLADAIAAGRRANRTVHLSLAGGTTPRPAYERLATLVDDWAGVELWLGDERLVPPDDPESNYRMVAETLLAGGALAHPVPTGGSIEQAADAYAREIRARVPAGPDGVPALDLALLGLGEDGHVASLFPHSPALEARGEICIAVHEAPKPPPDRVSLTLEMLRAAGGRRGQGASRGGRPVRSRSGRARQPARRRCAGADPGPGRRRSGLGEPGPHGVGRGEGGRHDHRTPGLDRAGAPPGAGSGNAPAHDVRGGSGPR